MRIKEEDKKTLLITFLMIFVLIFFSVIRIRTFSNQPSSFSPIIANIEIPSTENIFSEDFFEENISQESVAINDFKTIIIDEKVSFKYPSSWQSLKTDAFYEESDSTKLLFFAYPLSAQKTSSISFVKTSVEEESLRELIESDGLTKINSYQKNKDTGFISVKTEKQTEKEAHFLSHIEIIPKKQEKGFYLLSFDFLKKNEEAMLPIINKTLSSIQIRI